MSKPRKRDPIWAAVGLFLLFHGINPITDGFFGDLIFRGLDPWVETLWWNFVGTVGGIILLFSLNVFAVKRGLYCACGYDRRPLMEACDETYGHTPRTR